MSETPHPRRARAGLGRGLSSLLGDSITEAPVDDGGRMPPGVRMLPVTAMAPHPDQPRRHFDEAALDDLAASIAARGLIQPIVVRPHGKDFQIVAGERRWRAAQRARMHEVPVLVRDLSDADTMEIALVENIQRQDLNAIEEADAYRKLIDLFGHTQDELAKLVHKSRSHVANLLRLLDLPEPVRRMVSEQRLTMGHARAIANAPDPQALAERVIERGMTVRDTERLAREAKPGAPRGDADPTRARREASGGEGADADIVALETQLGDVLGIQVRIAHSEKGGTLTLTYSTLDQLDMVCQRLSGERI